MFLVDDKAYSKLTQISIAILSMSASKKSYGRYAIEGGAILQQRCCDLDFMSQRRRSRCDVYARCIYI